MSLYIYDLLDPIELSQMVKEKRVSKQVHPDLPISIYNYTNRAQFMGKWSKTERVCRGLIVEDGSGLVIARGPEKFFNYGQTGAPETTLDTLVRVTKKHDGSLGIGWKYEGQYGIATRGSFMSEQAVHATSKIDHIVRAQINEAGLDGTTPIYEIVYSGNRIVLDYGDLDALMELGEVELTDGTIKYRPSDLFHEVHDKKPYIRLSTALELPIPADEEGYVLDLFEQFPGGYLKSTGHVKLKGEEYKILHGLLTNTNARRIWVQLAARDCHQLVEKVAIDNEKEIEKVWATYVGHDPADFLRVNVEKDIVETLLTNVPDEFYDWVTKKIDAINDTVSDLIIQAITLGGQVSLVDDKRARHEMVKAHPLCKEILLYAEDRDLTRITLKAWKFAKPEGDDTPFRVDED
jgi:RNA ligase